MSRNTGVHILALLALLTTASPVAAQTSAADITALRQDITRRFDILPLRDGVALRPRSPSATVRSIEITRGPVAIDGVPATGAELRDRLGADADLVLRLSYLSDDDRRSFMGTAAPADRVADTPAAGRRESTDEAPVRRRSRSSNDDDRVHIGGGVTVRAGEVVDGNVVAVGGSADVDGEVRGDVVAIGGGVRLGPNAIVSDNVVVVGGALQRDPAARIDGQVQEIGLGNFRFDRMQWPTGWSGAFWGPRFGSTFALVSTLTRAAILCLLAALVVLFGRIYAERAGVQASMNAVKSGITGVLAQLLFFPVLVITIVVLCMTIVGIPLLLLIPFAMLALAIAGLVGFTGVAQRVGVFVAERAGWSTASYYTTTIIGIVALLSPVIIGRLIGIAGGLMLPVSSTLVVVGRILEYLAWTIGFGAMALARFERSQSGGTLSAGNAVPVAGN